MYLAVCRDDLARLVDDDRRVEAMRPAFGVGRCQLGIAEREADAEAFRLVEQRPGLGSRHLYLEEALDLGRILHVPAREKGRQREFRVDDQIAARVAGIAHECEQAHVHVTRADEQTSENKSIMRISYAVFCLKKKIRI